MQQVYFYYLVFLGIALLILFILKYLKKSEYPFYKNPKFISPAEREFYMALHRIVPTGHAIFAQISLGQLLKINKHGQEWWKYRNMIDRKTVDFVLVDAHTLDPKLVIELDDRSHETTERQTRDDFVNHALAAAKIPFLRMKCKIAYDEIGLLSEIRKNLSMNEK